MKLKELIPTITFGQKVKILIGEKYILTQGDKITSFPKNWDVREMDVFTVRGSGNLLEIRLKGML